VDKLSLPNEAVSNAASRRYVLYNYDLLAVSDLAQLIVLQSRLLHIPWF
jgi:hypothetical protein